MIAVISMLRGVNLGPHRRIKMDALRAVYESLGFADPQTYVQSGNVVFLTKERELTPLIKRIEDGIEKKFGFQSDVLLRTTAEMKAVVAKNPLRGAEFEPGKLLVTFLRGKPTKATRDAVLGLKADPEKLWLQGSELYIYFPDGQGKSKLPTVAIGKMLQITGTARNWNTVTSLLAMAEEMEAAK